MDDNLTLEEAKEIFARESGDFFDIISVEKDGNGYSFTLKRKDGTYAYASIKDNFRHVIIAPG